MKQFIYIIRKQSAQETGFIVRNYAAAMGHNLDGPTLLNNNVYVAPYCMLWALGSWDRPLLEKWCLQNKVAFESCFVHRPNGDRVAHPFVRGYQVMHVGLHAYRQWVTEYATSIVLNVRFPGDKPWPRPANGLLVDEAIYWPKFDGGLANIANTVEYKDDPERYRADCIEMVCKLQQSCAWDIILNLSHPAYALEVESAVRGTRGFLLENAVDQVQVTKEMEANPGVTPPSLAALETLIAQQPAKLKFLQIRATDPEWAARVVHWFDVYPGAELAWMHRRVTDPQMDPRPLWDTAFNALF